MSRPPSPVRLRRLGLKAQGLGSKRPLGTGLSGVQKALEQIGYVQIDTISVVARAHHHVLWNRVARYEEDMLNRLVKRHRAFEYWVHAAAYLPMRDFRFALPMMRAIADGEMWVRRTDGKLRERVLHRIRDEGPLFVRDFEDPRASRTGWWDWKPAKRALEELFMEGVLTSVERKGFQKRYELTERFLPADVNTRPPSSEEYADHAIDVSLRAHGFATARTMAYLCRDARLRKAVRERAAERAAEGDLEKRPGPGRDAVFAPPGTFDRALAPPPPRVRLLSPFDNTVIQRQRCAEVFDFDYTIECYVPEAKREYGYFVLPVVFGDQFVARLDAKAHRRERRFEIKALFLQEAAEAELSDDFAPALAAEVGSYARFNGCDELTIGDVTPKRWREPIAKALAAVQR
ncbi:MAG: winged helix-turn-helix domain-containing protein [Gammaproteobacteria bacterium]|nr:winged helix-turn-helix domain-containing protein [Gammaproteobacteria bacterium]MYB38104.1 winged helix-turn-helix domain-containing protein [Gammaproteobacteria bacterium]